MAYGTKKRDILHIVVCSGGGLAVCKKCCYESGTGEAGRGCEMNEWIVCGFMKKYGKSTWMCVYAGHSMRVWCSVSRACMWHELHKRRDLSHAPERPVLASKRSGS